MPRGGANFSSKELARVLSHYDIGIIQQIKPLSAGNVRAPKMVIVSDRGKFVLKRRPRGKDDPYRVAFAHSVQMYLAQKSFPVSTILASRDENNTVLHLENHIYELFEFVIGYRYDGSSEATTDAGRQLAKFHLNLANFSSQPKPLRGSFHDSAAVRGYLKTIGSEKATIDSKDLLRRVAESLMILYNASSVHVNELGFDSWPEQIVHGDWHPGNMLFSGHNVVAVLDFDSAKVAPIVTDLANGMLQFSITAGRPNPADWPAYLDQAKLIQLLSGYRSIIALDENQCDSLLNLMIETMIAEAVLPVATTGFFGNLTGLDFLKMIRRKCSWIDKNRDTLTKAIFD